MDNTVDPLILEAYVYYIHVSGHVSIPHEIHRGAARPGGGEEVF